jgi:hypothetical protein
MTFDHDANLALAQRGMQHLSESSVIEATFPPVALDPYDVERNPWFIALALFMVVLFAVGPIVYEWLLNWLAS